MRKTIFINEQGVKVTIATMAKPRKEEKTFRNNKYSIFNVGYSASKLNSRKFAAIP
jgi:hypothetical protein